MILDKFQAAAEAVLFAASEPVTITDIAKALETDEKAAKEIIKSLKASYEAEKRGIAIIEIEKSYQMCTSPLYYEYVKKIVQTSSKKPLTQSVMETLAIIAYKQPVTRAQIEEIRGVNCDHAVNKLLELGLISEKGRSEAVGKPILFGTGAAFLKYFGLESLKDLPDIDSDYKQMLIENYLLEYGGEINEQDTN